MHAIIKMGVMSFRKGGLDVKAKMGNLTVDVWRISHQSSLEPWVQDLFKQHIIHWYEANSNILMFPQAYGGAASVGFYFVRLGKNEYTAVNAKRFEREFSPLE